ncbi:hypothetical protein [Ferrovum myxofaciens]|uniref:hypothetical protein n=1 Tax=Ferrovum myxofaciens TaxID=416213 RepID=UPI003EBD74EC
MAAQKVFFNLFKDAKKEGEYFISHPSNGAKGSAEKLVSKNRNEILVFDVQVETLHLKGIFNKTDPAKMKPGSPNIWAEVAEVEGGRVYRLAGWYTTTKKSGEPVKTPYFSCSAQEKVEVSDSRDSNEPAHTTHQAAADPFENIPF